MTAETTTGDKPGSFSGPIKIVEVPGEGKWRLLEALSYTALDGVVYTAPTGFETDFASVPRFLWSIYPPDGPGYRKSAVIHDYLYAHAELFVPGDDHGHISRGSADDVFYEAMTTEGFRPSGRRVVWLGVRTGGWLPWRRYRQAQEGV